jgi:membrane protein implicated in regulation of membrane protease activity
MATTKRGLGDIIDSVIGDASAVVRGHIDLAKAEMRAGAMSAAGAVAAFTIALAMLNLAVILAFVAAAYGIAEAGLPLWASFLIIAGALVVCALITVLIAVKLIKRVSRAKRSATQMDQTVEALRKVARGTSR